MRVAVALVSLVAIVAIVGSAALVIDKDQPPRLAVEVTGVPGYVYYNRTYDLSIEYANTGGAVDGPVELVAQLPETFALAEHIADPTRHGERLVWTLDGLGAGERGSVSITVQGTLPDDLSKAVYDLPGYAGHAAFVEGFELAATLTAGGTIESTLAVADTGTPVATGTIVIVKDTTPESTDTFTFTELPDIPGCTVGPLFDDGSNTDNQVTCLSVPVGQYAVTEDSPAPDYALANLTCSTTETSGDTTTPSPGSRTANIDLDDGETVTCTFFNRYLNSLTVQKECGPANDPGQFSFQILNSNQQSVFGVTDVDCGTEFSIGGFDADTFEVVETAGTGTDLGDYNTTFGGACDTNGFVTVGATDRLTCIVTNTRSDTGTIRIIKDTVPPSIDSFFFPETPNVDACTLNGLVDDGINSGDGFNEKSCVLPVGQYDITENDPSVSGLGYELTGILCSSTETSGDTTTWDVPTRTAHIDLDPGETVTCTFTNEPLIGTIRIIKDTVPPSIDSFFFPETPNVDACTLNGLFDDGINSGDGFNEKSCVLPVGQYDITENDPSVSGLGYELTDILCSSTETSGDTTTWDVPTRTAHIDLDRGETVTCTFTNVPLELGTIRIIKDVTPGTDPQNFSFSDDIEDPCVIGTLDDDPGSGTPNSVTCMDVRFGNYEVTENVTPGWDLISVTCVSDLTQPNDSTGSVPQRTAFINLDPGETVTCTFENREPPPPTPTHTPTATATATPVETTTTSSFEPNTTPRAPIVAPTRTKTPTPITSVGGITPPSTGDGGFGGGEATAVAVLLLALLSGAVAVGLRLGSGLSRRR